MKSGTRNMLLLGAAGLAAYFLFFNKQSASSDSSGGSSYPLTPDGIFKQAASNIGDMFKQAQGDAAQQISNGIGAGFGTVYGLAGGTATDYSGFSQAFNKYVAGGTQTTASNPQIPGVMLNPNLPGYGGTLSGGASAWQAVLTSAAISGGLAVNASILPKYGGGVGQLTYGSTSSNSTASYGGSSNTYQTPTHQTTSGSGTAYQTPTNQNVSPVAPSNPVPALISNQAYDIASKIATGRW